jgi:AmmeMemoRadiSam system protein B
MARGGAGVRRAVWHGQFYPSDPGALEAEVVRHMDGAEVPRLGGEPIGIVAPHAGYVYSGPVAGAAYASVRRRSCGRVVVLAPSHRAAFSGASVWPSGSYETPLGPVPIDEEGAAEIRKRGGALVSDLPAAHRDEHALEVQIPFLQTALGPFRLVPLVLGSHDLEYARDLGALLDDTFGTADTFYVASSDLSHFHPYDEAVRIDRLLIDMLERLEVEKLSRALERGAAEACGAGPILALAFAARDRWGAGARLLAYANSGDTAGDRREVVGYAAFAFVREAGR